ncbi:beta-galactosidase [Streptomyces sp. N2-109]|uniref:Beta-galactosidase n=1 Tax=Streptomyces gossypii TaxID=2883101 RepID=A0ABT2JQB8_9ACTN|nr:beta-galactosidase [Streptomyces gossypii]MCT2590083.1 beta-galactosidase [Streptomyces gossypii]
MPALDDTTRGRILFGGDYNPEQWPEAVWHDDIRLMREAGVNSVTLGVFSWAKLEPRPGAREFGWLDRLMDLLHDNGIGVVLATPTSAPPPWLGRLHPETLPRDENGQTEWWGSRQHFSHSSEAYRRHAAALTEDLAARYGTHPALTMWHINNEYCTYDWGDEAAAAYQGGALDGLPAVLRHGRTWYVSTLPEPTALRALLARVSAEAGVRPPLGGLPPGVEAVRRGQLLFLLNHRRDAVTVDLPDGHHLDVLTGETFEGTLTLTQRGAAVLEPHTP